MKCDLETYIAPVAPNAADHEINTSTSNPSLHSIPDACHRRSVENRP